ncbi:MAG: helix-turn-helix transcriptional regulator [Oscillospiraceae bacterium]
MYRRIRDMREDRDLYQKDLAEYLRCSQVCYSYYEMGKRDIPTDVLIRLADFYGTSVDYLLGRTDEKAPTRRAAVDGRKVSQSSRLASRE